MNRASIDTAPTARRRIVIVDDHPMTRFGVRHRLETERDLTVVAEAGSATEAIEVVKQHRPELVIIDTSLGGGNGLELLKDLHALHPGLPVLVFSMHDEAQYAERVLRAGARGYIMKQESPEIFIEAVRRVLAGEIYLSSSMRTQMLQRFARPPAHTAQEAVAALSDRELEIFEWIGRGTETREIADRLKVAVSTIETHRAHIKEKLGLTSPTQLIRAAVEWTSNHRV